MAFVSPALSADDIIRRAASRLGLEAVVQGKDDKTALRLYDDLNDFLQGLGRIQNWWFLRRESFFVTADKVREYTLRTAASATVTLSGSVSDGDSVTIDSRVYEFDTDGSISGNVTVDVSGSTAQADALAALKAAINADSGRSCHAVQNSASTLELYWSGNAGAGKALSGSGSNVSVDATFTASMPDFSRLTALAYDEFWPLRKIDPDQQIETAYQPSDGHPQGYAVTGEATLRIYSGNGGGPDGIYALRVGYQAMPSAVLPDGSGRIDFPTEFQDILPLGLAVTHKANGWDEAAVFGDSYLARRLQDMMSFMPDETPDYATVPDVASQLFIRQELRLIE